MASAHLPDYVQHGAPEHGVEVNAGSVAGIGARIGHFPAAGGRATARWLAIRLFRHFTRATAGPQYI